MSDQLESQAMSFIYRITQHSFDGTIHPELYEADVDVIRQLLAVRRIDKASLNAKSIELASAHEAIKVLREALEKIASFCPPDPTVDQLDDYPEMLIRLHNAEIGDTARQALSTTPTTSLRQEISTAQKEPGADGCAHCNSPLYAAIKCGNCGKIHDSY